jgi:hypothetical protein
MRVLPITTQQVYLRFSISYIWGLVIGLFGVSYKQTTRACAPYEEEDTCAPEKKCLVGVSCIQNKTRMRAKPSHPLNSRHPSSPPPQHHKHQRDSGRGGRLAKCLPKEHLPPQRTPAFPKKKRKGGKKSTCATRDAEAKAGDQPYLC